MSKRRKKQKQKKKNARGRTPAADAPRTAPPGPAGSEDAPAPPDAEAPTPPGASPLRTVAIRAAWALGGAVLLAWMLLLIYRPALECPFFYDERRLIIGSPQVRAGAPWPAFRLNPGRGLPTATFALSYAAWEEAPYYWRATQVALHGLTAALLGVLVWLHLRGEPFRAAAITAAGAVGLFALHPLAVESAVYVWARGSVFYTQLALLAACAGTLAAGLAPGWRRWAGYAAGLPFVLLGGLSKAAGIVPAGAAWIAAVGARDRRRALLILAGGVLLGGAALLAGRVFLAGAFAATLHGLEERLDDTAEIAKHVWTQTGGFLLYLRLLLPLPDQYAISHLVEPPGLAVGLAGGALLLGALGATVWAALRGWTLAATGGAILVFAFLPYFFLPSRSVVEYKAYPMLAGAVLVCVALLRRLDARRRAHPVFAIALTALIVWTGALSWRQARTWTGREAIWRQALVAHPRNPEPRTALGYAAYQRAKAAERRRDRDAFERHMNEMGEALRTAVRDVETIHRRSGPLVKNNWCWTLDLYAVWLRRRGELDAAEHWWKGALAFNPEYVSAMVNLSYLYIAQNRWGEAREFYRMAKRNIHDPYEARLVGKLDPHFRDKTP